MSGGIAGKDLEGGFLFSNPAGTWGGDDQVVAVGQGGNAGTVVQFGGPSYYPFSPGAGGYPGVGGSVPNYINGTTINMTFTYTIDPNTTKPAFEYAVNGQYAASAPGNNYFDLANPVGGPGDFLGGYFQIAPTALRNPPRSLSWAWGFCRWPGCCAVAPEIQSYSSSTACLGMPCFCFLPRPLTALCKGICKLEVHAAGGQPVPPCGDPREPARPQPCLTEPCLRILLSNPVPPA